MCMNIVETKYYFPGNGCKTDKDVSILVETAENGEKHVPLSEYNKLVSFPHVTNDGESKTGKGVQSLSFPIWFTCNHSAPCFKIVTEDFTEPGKAVNESEKATAAKKVKKSKKKAKRPECPCYGTKGFFSACPSLAIYYAETFKSFIDWEEDALVKCILSQIKENTVMFRFCVIGDMNPKIFRVMLKVVEARKDVRFYTYTKKYRIVNNYVAENGGSISAAIPENFSILFSEWEGFPMENPYGFPLSSYVPFEERENLVLSNIDMVCPCSSPNWAGTCIECGRCAHAIPGGHVYLIEHSTSKTREADAKKSKTQKELKDKRKELSKAVKSLKKVGGEAYEKALKSLESFKEEHINRFIRKG